MSTPHGTDVPLISHPVRDYVIYPQGHPHAGSWRLVDFGWVLFSVIIIQILLTLGARVARRQRQAST